MITVNENITVNERNLYGLYIAVGRQGSGKTLFMVKLLIDNLKYKSKIFSNINLYNIDRDYTKISLSTREETVTDVPLMLDMLDDDINVFNDSIIFLDEIHKDLDSRDFWSESSRKVQGFFSQLRKRNCLVLATAQYFGLIDNRVRKQCFNVFDMRKISDEMFNVVVSEVDGYYYRPIINYDVKLSDYFKYYDTNEIVL
jgi:hypothetical protein